MKQYYLSDIIGTGATGDAFRPSILDTMKATGIKFSMSAAMPPGDANGHPTASWCLVVIAAANHAPLRSVAGVDPLPVVSLDAMLWTANGAALAALNAAVARRGIPVTPNIGAGYRDLIRAVGKNVQSYFDENNFDAPEPT